jgi:hypothetical protein
MKISEAYGLGVDAFFDMVELSRNPYEPGTDDHEDWSEGWKDARADHGEEDEGEE